MENEKRKQWQSKTLSTKYSSHEQGQHYVVFLQTTPNKKVLIGRLFEDDKGRQILKDPRGNQIGEPFADRESAERYMEEHGNELLQKEFTRAKAIVGQVYTLPPEAEKKEAPSRTPKKAAQKLAAIRDSKSEKTKTKGISR